MSNKDIIIDWKKLLISIFLCQLTGVMGALFTTPAIPVWYASLNKPSFVPPSWAFSVVWPLLYLLMGIALYMIWNKGYDVQGKKLALGIFGVQLFLNFLWSVLFFGLNSPFLGFVGIILLWSVILLNIWLFYNISKSAGLLLVPYLLWVSFATLLNYYILLLNP